MLLISKLKALKNVRFVALKQNSCCISNKGDDKVLTWESWGSWWTLWSWDEVATCETIHTRVPLFTCKTKGT